jgi:hypothetical protein
MLAIPLENSILFMISIILELGALGSTMHKILMLSFLHNFLVYACLLEDEIPLIFQASNAILKITVEKGEKLVSPFFYKPSF